MSMLTLSSEQKSRLRCWKHRRKRAMSEGKRILITASDDDFFTGYQRGYLRFVTLYKGKTLTDDTIFQVVSTVLMEEAHTDRWNIGYVSGWYAALYNKAYRVEDTDFTLKVVKGG